MHPAIWPYLIGLLPIFLARTWRARWVAICFGCVSIACGVMYAWIIHHSSGAQSEVQNIRSAAIGALSIALVSAVVTYLVDKNHNMKT
jgi:hypothetical protein